ncbi:MAG: hypothetical protein Q9159_000045 [Coniocarpon cinnabarinum]
MGERPRVLYAQQQRQHKEDERVGVGKGGERKEQQGTGGDMASVFVVCKGNIVHHEAGQAREPNLTGGTKVQYWLWASCSSLPYRAPDWSRGMPRLPGGMAVQQVPAGVSLCAES